jgi:hypothetical protein
MLVSRFVSSLWAFWFGSHALPFFSLPSPPSPQRRFWASRGALRLPPLRPHPPPPCLRLARPSTCTAPTATATTRETTTLTTCRRTRTAEPPVEPARPLPTPATAARRLLAPTSHPARRRRPRTAPTITHCQAHADAEPPSRTRAETSPVETSAIRTSRAETSPVKASLGAIVRSGRRPSKLLRRLCRRRAAARQPPTPLPATTGARANPTAADTTAHRHATASTASPGTIVVAPGTMETPSRATRMHETARATTTHTSTSERPSPTCTWA